MPETVQEVQAATARWEEWRPDDCPWFVELSVRVDESYDVTLVSSARTGLKPGTVTREVVVRRCSQEGPVVLRERVSSLVGAVDTLTECMRAGVPEQEWRVRLWGRL